MNWKFWTWPGQIRAAQEEAHYQKDKQRELVREVDRLEEIIADLPTPDGKPIIMLHGWDEAKFRAAFYHAPDNELFAGTLEQCDRLFMETANELVNVSEQLTDGQLRQRVGQLRGLTELREALTLREEQARRDQQAKQGEETEGED